MSLEWIGLVAGALTSFGLLPQVIRVFKLRSAREISFLWNASFLIGVCCWLAYGIYLRSVPLILWNTITAIFGIALIYAKIKYGR